MRKFLKYILIILILISCAVLLYLIMIKSPMKLNSTTGKVFSQNKSPAKQLNESELIIKVNKDDFLKVAQKEVLKSFESNKGKFHKVVKYLLEHERELEARPVYLSKDVGTDKIGDKRIKTYVDTFFDKENIKRISSLNDRDIQEATFIIGSEYGVYEQGIKYVLPLDRFVNDTTYYNYTKEYVNLGNGWYYYLYYYNKIKDEDIYRKIAWDKLSSMDRKNAIYDWNKGIVTLTDWNSVDYKVSKKKFRFVVSVCFNTSLDGLLGPAITYIDPATKEIVGYNLRY